MTVSRKAKLGKPHVKRPPLKLALPWILEEDWPQWRSVDRDVASYQRWLELFDKNRKVAEAYGWPYERVPVRPDPFLEWCKVNKRAAGKYDRCVYALSMLHESQGNAPANAPLDMPASEPPRPIGINNDRADKTSEVSSSVKTNLQEVSAPAS